MQHTQGHSSEKTTLQSGFNGFYIETTPPLTRAVNLANRSSAMVRAIDRDDSEDPFARRVKINTSCEA